MSQALTYHEQRLADKAHHEQRIAAWKDSTDPFTMELVRQSRFILENPAWGYRSCKCEPPCHLNTDATG